MTSIVVGNGALLLGLCCGLVACVAWIRHSRDAQRSQPRWWTIGAGLCALTACAALEFALLRHDFSVRYVAEHGGRDVSVYYTVTGMWAALEGSLLLWLLVLAAFLMFVLWRVRNSGTAWDAPALAVLCAIVATFFAVVLLAGNPFQAVHPVPADGPGPNPLLRTHPAVGVHPPLLYAGYAGLSVPFAYTVALLWRGGAPAVWARTVRPWVMAPWALLTAGIALGAWWSYAVLGWGGYWAWDPVENASLLPWLTASALAHALVVTARGRGMPVWPVTLAAASFFLVLLGTFLTRSGVVASVHTFTQSRIGPVLLSILCVLTLGWLLLLAARGHVLRADTPIPGGLYSRRIALAANNILLTVIATTVLAGTLYPLLVQLTDGQEISVGSPYYNQVLAPVAFVMLVLMAVAPLTTWSGHPARLVKACRFPAAIAAGAAGAAGLTVAVAGAALAAACGLAAFVLACLVREVARWGKTGRRRGPAADNRRRVAGTLIAHFAVVLAAIAVIASAGARAEQRDLPIGTTVTAQGVTIRLLALTPVGAETPARAEVEVSSPGHRPTILRPTLAVFPAYAMAVPRPAIRSAIDGDTYLTLLGVDTQAGIAVLRIAVNPTVSLLWFAGGLLVLGIAVAAWPRRPRRLEGGDNAPHAMAAQPPPPDHGLGSSRHPGSRRTTGTRSG